LGWARGVEKGTSFIDHGEQAMTEDDKKSRLEELLDEAEENRGDVDWFAEAPAIRVAARVLATSQLTAFYTTLMLVSRKNRLKFLAEINACFCSECGGAIEEGIPAPCTCSKGEST